MCAGNSEPSAAAPRHGAWDGPVSNFVLEAAYLHHDHARLLDDQQVSMWHISYGILVMAY